MYKRLYNINIIDDSYKIIQIWSTIMCNNKIYGTSPLWVSNYMFYYYLMFILFNALEFAGLIKNERSYFYYLFIHFFPEPSHGRGNLKNLRGRSFDIGSSNTIFRRRKKLKGVQPTPAPFLWKIARTLPDKSETQQASFWHATREDTCRLFSNLFYLEPRTYDKRIQMFRLFLRSYK